MCTEAWISGSISSREPGKKYKSAGTYKQLQNGTENIKGNGTNQDGSMPPVGALGGLRNGQIVGGRVRLILSAVVGVNSTNIIES